MFTFITPPPPRGYELLALFLVWIVVHNTKKKTLIKNPLTNNASCCYLDNVNHIYFPCWFQQFKFKPPFNYEIMALLLSSWTAWGDCSGIGYICDCWAASCDEQANSEVCILLSLFMLPDYGLTNILIVLENSLVLSRATCMHHTHMCQMIDIDATWTCVNGSCIAHFLPVVMVAVLTLKMVPHLDAARWTGLRPPLDSCSKTCPSGESPSCTAPTRTSRCRPSPCRATHPSPVRGESKNQFLAYSFPSVVFYTRILDFTLLLQGANLTFWRLIV